MRRREFITLLGGAAAWPLAARAQDGRMRRVGVLCALAESDPEVKGWFAAFQDGLQRLGWVQGRNISIEYRWSGGDEQRLQTDAAELVQTAPDVIFVAPTPALAALYRQTRSLPIVFVQVSERFKLGFVADLARPGGNITGFANFEHPIGGKWLELLKDTAPGRTRVAVLFEPDNPSQDSGANIRGAVDPRWRARRGRHRARHHRVRARAECCADRGAEHRHNTQSRPDHRSRGPVSLAGSVSVSLLRQQRRPYFLRN
jgi:ABC transporter substrate binding protein